MEAHRAILALEALENDGYHRGVLVAIMNAKAAYRRLADHQGDTGLTTAQTALELLQAKLKAIGHPI